MAARTRKNNGSRRNPIASADGNRSPKAFAPPPRERDFLTPLILLYAAVVLIVDWFYHGPHPYGFDVYKFCAWFLIPFLVCLPGMDWGWYGIRRWRRMDYSIFAAALVLEMLAVLAVHFLPSLRQQLPTAPDTENVSRFILLYTVYNFSWLLGWEFLHRYVILRRVSVRWPKWGWLLVPVFEGVYHLNWWPVIAMPAAMVLFSLVATWWSLKRQNGLLPLLAHLIIELQLTVFLLF